MVRFLFILMISLCTAGCGPHYVDYFPYHDDGTIKPHIALLPILDGLDVKLPSDVAADMSRTIHYELMDSGLLYLLPPDEVREGYTKIGKVDFFETDKALLEQYCEADFIVLIELIEHSVEPTGDKCSGLAKLIMKARLKIIDARCRQPRIALQEIMIKDYIVCGNPGIYEDADDHYANSFGRAHRWFADALSRRLEEVIRSVF